MIVGNFVAPYSLGRPAAKCWRYHCEQANAGGFASGALGVLDAPGTPSVLTAAGAAGLPALAYVIVGAALSSPVTPSTSAASDAGSETGRLLARSGYLPALASAVAL